MASHATDPRWSKVLSLTGHELRNPLGVVVGYIRMVLSERSGPLAPFQRKALEESMHSCGRLKEIVEQLGALRDLEDGVTKLQSIRIESRTLLEEAIDAVPEMTDRTVAIELDRGPEEVSVAGDPARLRTALASVIFAIRREVVSSDRVVVRQRLTSTAGTRSVWIAIAPPERIDRLANPGTDGLTTFDEWRGGLGLSLPIARRVINLHGGTVWSPVEDSRAGAALALPVV
jgi:signal transduction histidine kinase